MWQRNKTIWLPYENIHLNQTGFHNRKKSVTDTLTGNDSHPPSFNRPRVKIKKEVNSWKSSYPFPDFLSGLGDNLSPVLLCLKDCVIYRCHLTTCLVTCFIYAKFSFSARVCPYIFRNENDTKFEFPVVTVYSRNKVLAKDWEINSL